MLGQGAACRLRPQRAGAEKGIGIGIGLGTGKGMGKGRGKEGEWRARHRGAGVISLLRDRRSWVVAEASTPPRLFPNEERWPACGYSV